MKIAFGENPKTVIRKRCLFENVCCREAAGGTHKGKIYDTKLHAAGCPEGWNELEMEQAQEQVMDDSQKTDADRKVDFQRCLLTMQNGGASSSYPRRDAVKSPCAPRR